MKVRPGGVTEGEWSRLGSALHRVVPAPSQRFGSVQASEMANSLRNNCFLEDTGLGGVE